MKKIITILTAVFGLAYAANAQEATKSAYFLDGYAFRHEYNPAFVSARNYLALPGLSSVNVSVNSNLGISTFLYPINGQLATFMHPDVSKEDFLKKIRNNNNFALGASTKILSIGAWGKKGGFTTVGIDVKADGSLNLPGDIFEFMKNPGASQSYDISNLGLRAHSRLELSIGHSRKIGERLNVGAKVKALVGLADASVNIDRLNLTMGQDKWAVKAFGSARISSGKGLITLENTPEGQLDFTSLGLDIEGAMNNGIGKGLIGGYGAALDLGATYEVLDGLTVSAALLDLGFISWNNSIHAKANGGEFAFEGLENVTPDMDFDEQLGTITDKMAEMIVMEKVSEARHTDMLSMRLNAGIEYEMPFWKGMSVGALYSGKFQGAHSFNEGRVALNFAFGNVLALTGSYAISNFGHSAGAALNLHCAAFQLYLATDALFFDVTAPFTIEGTGMAISLPYKNTNLGVNLGLVFNLSKRKDKLFDRY